MPPESRIYTRLAEVEDRIEGSRQDISDELAVMRADLRDIAAREDRLDSGAKDERLSSDPERPRHRRGFFVQGNGGEGRPRPPAPCRTPPPGGFDEFRRAADTSFIRCRLGAAFVKFIKANSQLTLCASLGRIALAVSGHRRWKSWPITNHHRKDNRETTV